MKKELLETAWHKYPRELCVWLKKTEGVDGISRYGADITGIENTGLLDRAVGLEAVEVLPPELDAAFDGVEVFVGLFVDVGEDSGTAGAGGAGGVGVEDAKGAAGGVAGYGKGVAAGEGDAEAFFEGVGLGSLGGGGDPEGGCCSGVSHGEEQSSEES